MSCNEEQEPWTLTQAQQELIGRGVNFNTSVADNFMTRATYRHDGSFNEEDIMTIYRQYSHDGGKTFDAATAYRVYWLKTKYATGTSISLETNWLPKPGPKEPSRRRRPTR